MSDHPTLNMRPKTLQNLNFFFAGVIFQYFEPNDMLPIIKFVLLGVFLIFFTVCFIFINLLFYRSLLIPACSSIILHVSKIIFLSTKQKIVCASLKLH